MSARAHIENGLLTGASFLDDPALQKVLACLNGDGEETRIAGGAVRNALLGEKVRDIDLATTALPTEASKRAKAAGFKVIPTGIEHGTVTIVADGIPFEVTTLREDINTDGRHAVVRFGRDFTADAMRRDFTINGLFVDQNRRVHDFTGGLADIEAHKVRFIGNARQRIEEDYLRILRLFRFHAAYGRGAVDRAGLEASIAGRDGLSGLSNERIGAELMKLLEAKGAVAALVEMADAGLLGPLIAAVPHPSRLRNLAASEDMQGLQPDTTLRLTALAACIPDDAARLQEHLRLSNLQTTRMRQAIQAWQAIRNSDAPPPKTDLYRYLFQHGRRAALDGLLLAQAGAPAAGQTGNWRSAYTFLHDTPEPRLPFTGSDLIKRGVKSGPAMGALLKRLQASWIRAGFPKQPEILARLLEEALQPPKA